MGAQRLCRVGRAQRDPEQELSYAGDARAHAEARLEPGGRQGPRAGLSSACGGWVLRPDPVWPDQVPAGAALGGTAAGPIDPGCSLSGKRRGGGGARVVFVPCPSARSPGAAARADTPGSPIERDCGEWNQMTAC
ncbi:unnamed protein product [Natator depressus]